MKNKNNPFYYYYTLPCIIAFVIFYLSCLIPTSNLPEVELDFFIPIDKIVHFCMYFGLGITIGFNYIWLNKGNIVLLRLFLFALLLPIIYGGVIEILQGQYFNRSTELEDFIANSIGAICAIVFSLLLRKYLLKKYRYTRY